MQQYKNKIPAYWMIQLLGIVLLLNVVQCKCNKDDGVENPKLSLQVDNSNLIGNDKTTKAILTNSTETAADGNKYGLLAEIKQGEGTVKCGTNELTIGTAQALKALIGWDELGQESKDFEITLEPDSGVTEFEIALAVVDLDDNNKELATKTIQWTGGWSATIVKLAADFKGSETAEFQVENDGAIEWNTNEIAIEITSSTGATFQVGSLTTARGSLTAALGRKAIDIKAGNQSKKLTLQLDNAKSQPSADITIQLWRQSDGQELATKTIQWTS